MSTRLPTLFHVDERLGAWQHGGGSQSGGVSFRLYFPTGFDPQIHEIRVAGTFQIQLGGAQDWDFPNGFLLTPQTVAEGTFWSCTLPTLNEGYYQYKYLVTFTNGEQRIVSDPYTRYGGIDHQNAAFVIGGSPPAANTVTPLAQRRPLADLVVYEMHIDDFTDEYRGLRSPLDAVVDKLDGLVDLGINAILFMPWTAWKNRDFDWGYEPYQYFAVEYRYANDLSEPAEKISWLKRMISECHTRGIHVIMDGVFNHVSVDFPYKGFYLDESKCPYTGQFGGMFPGLQDLNFNNQCTQDFIRDVCLYWIDVFGIDGIRFDNTTNFYIAGTPSGIPELLEDINDYVTGKGQTNFSMTLEHLDVSASDLVKSTKATSYWDNALYGHCFDVLWNGAIPSQVLHTLNNARYLPGPAKVPTIYLGNHDHSHVAWQAGARQNQGGLRWYRTQPFVIALLTSPGVPLIQNGQEFAEDYWIPEDDQGSGRRVLPRPLRWKHRGDKFGSQIYDNVYKKLIKIRNAHAALRSSNFYPPEWENWQTQFNPAGFGVDTERQIVIYHRWGVGLGGKTEYFIIAINFSETGQDVEVPFPKNGIWKDLLNADEPIQVASYGHVLPLYSNWGRVLFFEE